MLTVEGLDIAYGQARILFGIDVAVAAGEVVALAGRNGAGKSTLVRTIIGLLAPEAGRIRFRGHDIAGKEPHRIARLGLGYVPEERRIFSDLTVAENLAAAKRPPRPGLDPWTPLRLFEIFPDLEALQRRRAGSLSGGEQQMLTLARTLMTNPLLLLLDEPSEGLAPLVVERMAAAVLHLKAAGLAILLCEQNVRFAGRIADRVSVIETGHIRWNGPMADFLADAELQRTYLAV